MTESSLFLILALGALAAAGWFAFQASKANASAVEAKGRLEGVTLLREAHDRAIAERDAAKAEASKLAADLAAEKARSLAKEEEGVKREAAMLAMKLEVEKTFQAAAAQALDANQQRFLAVANEAFEKHKQAAQGGVKEVLAPVQEAFAKLSGSVDALEKSRTQDKASLSEQLRTLNDEIKENRNVTGKLVHALRQSPKARGRWGEHSLRNALEMGGLAPKIDFDEQTTVDGDDGKLRPDVVIRMPGGRQVIVDSKVAFSAFLDALEAPDEQARDILLKKHASELRAHMKALSSKEYWRHVADTVDFVVMFVPGDNLVHEALDRDPALQDDAFASKVIIASPTSMVALARIIAFGWRQEQSAKNAQEIAQLGRTLYERLSVMGEHIGRVGKSIGDSVSRYNDMVASLDSRVMVAARKFKELGAADSGREIEEINPVETMPRALAPPQTELELSPPDSNTEPKTDPKRRGR